MDAVVLMDAVQSRPQGSPPSPPRKRRGISPNAALITGVGTLLLALGIGVLIGRSGEHTVASAPQTPQVVTVQSGAAPADTVARKATTTGGNGVKAKTAKQKQAALTQAEAHPAAEEVLKPTGDVKLPPSTVEPGDKCESGAAGCEGGEFTGEFFGE
jgi:hypothetical protein